MMITRSVKENGTKSGLVYHIEKMLKPISENVPAATIKKLPNDHNGNTSKSHQMHKIFNKTSFGCNCRNKDNFPFNDECLTPNIIYRADINTDNDHKFYFGSVEKNFKQRQTIWQLKSNTFNYSTKWQIASKVCGYANSLSCKLCLMEKYQIINHFDDLDLLNK